MIESICASVLINSIKRHAYFCLTLLIFIVERIQTTLKRIVTLERVIINKYLFFMVLYFF